MRILIVEDDPDLAELVALGLRNESYAVDLRRPARRRRRAAGDHGLRRGLLRPLPARR
ncbi:hypothetical protein [Streptosporangium vulgare]|uniref:hypothetical protein n=1 Tax=Streptosporangium vulgare TaxID=46190 RepID=UPI0031D07EF2